MVPFSYEFQPLEDHYNSEKIFHLFILQLIDVYWQPTYSKNIKLIATALILKQRDGYFKNFFGKATKISPFGTVHTAVQIGGVILDWNNSSLLASIGLK